MKNSTGYPSNTYRTLVRQAQSEVRKHIVDAPRDMKQVENAKWNERQRKRLSNDADINLKEIGYESNFVRQLVIHEEVRIIGFCEGLLETLKTLIGRSDLPTQVLSCDTTFNLGLFYGTFVIFRHTEILESPSILEHICSYFTCFMKAKLQRIIKLFGISYKKTISRETCCRIQPMG